ncbi:MAG: 4-amino-4-deoxy-L-arabinose transferase-like glycosyltransferase [Hyphomicrobiaceae bacterium]|jgi:4-amino-4-deoxy-L-arabinose transferase-like glycosyltransferase
MPVTNSTRAAFVATIWVLGLHATLFWLSFCGSWRGLVGDESQYITAAKGLLATGELTLGALWPPLYPWFLAAAFSFGVHPLVALAIAQTLLLAVVAAAMRVIVSDVLGSRRAGSHAGFFVLGFPPLAAFAHYAWPEILFLALLLPAVAFLVRRPDSVLAALAAGLFCGLALLCKLVFGPLLALIALGLLAHRRGTATRSAVVLLVVSSTVVLLVGPQLRTDTTIARVDTNLAFNTWVGLKDTSRRTFVDSIAGEEYRAFVASAPDADGRTKVLYEKIGALLEDRGLARVATDQLSKQYVRLFDPESVFTAQLPGGAFDTRASGYRDVSPALGAVLRAVSWSAYFTLLGLALVGGGWLRPWVGASRPQRIWMAVFAAFFAYNLAIFSVLHVISRYRIALLPGLFLFAAAASARIFEGRTRQ